jgi:hypothetical protein
MAINFPNSPVANVTTYTSGTTTWQWDGTVWNVISDPGFASEDYVDNAISNAALAGLDAFDNEDFFAKLQASEPVLDQHVFYVSPDGTDSAQLDGRRTDTAWRTIEYALEQVPENSTVLVRNGTYLEQLPLRVPSNVAVIGESMRTTIVEPAEGLDRNGDPNNQSTMWLLNDGCLLKNMTFDGLTGFTTGLAPADISSYTARGVFIALDPDNPIIVKSPYVVECSAFSTGGVGAVVDGSVHTSGNKSMLFHGYTNLHDNGVGFWVKNGGKAEIVSCFTYFCHVGYLTSSGGQIRALNGNCSYGLYGALSSGFDSTETPITGTLLGNQLTWDTLTLIGSFSEGDTIEGVTSGALGTVLEVQLGADKLYYTTVSGTFVNGETIRKLDLSASAQLLAEGGVTGQNGFVLVVDNLTSRPIPGTSVSFTGTGVDAGSYVVRAVSGTYVNASSVIILALANEKVDPTPGGTALVVRKAFSQTRLTGHDFLNIGTGGVTTTNYPGTPTQAPSQGNEIIEQRPGRVYYVSTDQDGNFRVGGFFRVNQATGVATLNASAFDLSGLNSLRLGAVGAQLGELINEFSSDDTLSSNSNEKVPTEAAVRGYFENILTDVVPNTSITYDLGKTDKRWKDLWSSTVKTSTVITGTLDTTYSNTTLPTSGGGSVITINNSDTSTSSNSSILYRGVDAGGTFRHGAAITWGKSGAWTAGGGNYGSYLSFGTRADGNNTLERMRIDSSGNVGIGTTSPPTLLATSVSSGFNGITTISSSSSFMGISSNSSTNSAIAWKSTESLGFGTITSTAWGGYTERMRIDSAGNVGIGTTSPVGKLNVIGGLGVGAALTGDNAITPLASGGILISGGNQASLQTYTSVGNATTVGALNYYAAIDQSFNRFFDIAAYGSTTGATGNIRFLTGSSTSTERMRIDGSGNVRVGSSDTALGSINTVNTFGFKNRIINGAMQIYQRSQNFSNSGTTVALSYSTVDRYQIFRFGAVTGLNAIVSTTGGPTGLPHFVRIQRAVGNTATNGCVIAQSIESINCYDLAGQTVTLSFWARAGANFSGTASVLGARIISGTGVDGNLYNGLTGQSVFVDVPVTLTTSWQRFTATGTVPSNSQQVGIQLVHTPTGTAGSTDHFDVTGVQLEIGSQATSFDYRPYGSEDILCKRYFQRLAYIPGVASSSTAVYAFGMFPVSMRVVPTIGATGPLNYQGDGATNATQSSVGFSSNASTTFALSVTVNNFSGLTGGRTLVLAIPANNSNTITLDAEL